MPIQTYDGYSIPRDGMHERYIGGSTLTGHLGFPILEGVGAKPETAINLVYSQRVRDTRKMILHCYTDDAHLERMWRNADVYLDNFRDFPYIVMPDFSIVGDMPQCMKYWQRYRNMALAWYYSQKGIKVVPSMGCMGTQDDEWLVEGMPHESTLAVSTKGRIQNREETEHFLRGLKWQIEVLRPMNLLMFGTVPDGWVDLCPTTHFLPDERGESRHGLKGQKAEVANLQRT